LCHTPTPTNATSMTDLNREKELAKQIIAEIIRQAGGAFDNKTNLYKAFYYAHLQYAEQQPGYLSNWPIVRMPRGPGIHDFDMLLGELMAEGKVETKQVDWAGCSGFRFRLCEGPVERNLLPQGSLEAIAFAVEQVKGKSADQVSRDTHETSRAWKNAQDGDELNIYIDSIPEDEYQRRLQRTKDSATVFSDWL